MSHVGEKCKLALFATFSLPSDAETLKTPPHDLFSPKNPHPPGL